MQFYFLAIKRKMPAS